MLPQRLSNTTFRLMARLLASAFGSFDFAQGVFLRHSVAMGEVAFGRSDIDFTIVLNQPLGSREEAERLVSLNRCRQALKVAVPILGECDVGTADELIRSYRADPFRASIGRRTAMVLYGEPLENPELAVGQSAALSWMVFWFAHFIPVAMRKRNCRNLRKFAIDMWNAARTATGDIDEPYPTRREAMKAWQSSAGQPFEDGQTPEQIFGQCCRIAGEAYRRLFTPLPVLDRPITGRQGRRNWVLILESAEPPPPARYSWPKPR